MEVEVVQTFGRHHNSGAISGQNTVAAAGTAEALGTGRVNGALRVKALSTNSGLVYVGNDGADDVTSANGFELSASDEVIFAYVGNLEDLYIDSATNDDGVSWIILEVQ